MADMQIDQEVAESLSARNVASWKNEKIGFIKQKVISNLVGMPAVRRYTAKARDEEKIWNAIVKASDAALKCNCGCRLKPLDYEHEDTENQVRYIDGTVDNERAFILQTGYADSTRGTYKITIWVYDTGDHKTYWAPVVAEIMRKLDKSLELL